MTNETHTDTGRHRPPRNFRWQRGAVLLFWAIAVVAVAIQLNRWNPALSEFVNTGAAALLLTVGWGLVRTLRRRGGKRRQENRRLDERRGDQETGASKE
jgi:membrane protein implicated in regulation of membrane protease activity